MLVRRKALLIALSSILWVTGTALIVPASPSNAQSLSPEIPSTIVSAPYDPLSLLPEQSYEIRDLEVLDSTRDRSIPLRVYLPQSLLPQSNPVPVILLSHGLGGSRAGLSYLASHWAARGYAVIALQHLGSDETVWRSVAPEHRYKALAEAASVENFLLRVKDVPAVLDQLEAWQRDPEQDWVKSLDLNRIGMGGYSFGAITAQAIGGQRFFGRPLFQDDRIQAMVLLSPSSPQKEDPHQAFRSVHIPSLLMTGTADVSSIGNIDLASRLAVFSALPPGDKYEVVLKDAEHSAFGDAPLATDRYPRNPNHHRVTLALSTALWDAYLQQEATAQAWLASDAPRAVMEENDRWQWN
ncbi:MAG: alpha/beta hydrolase family protein [Prochlorotrichaceae cyanobacterium]|jgi:predicted dienelactone hydrolase